MKSIYGPEIIANIALNKAISKIGEKIYRLLYKTYFRTLQRKKQIAQQKSAQTSRFKNYQDSSNSHKLLLRSRNRSRLLNDCTYIGLSKHIAQENRSELSTGDIASSSA